MKKYLVPITLSFLSTAALAEGKWNVGVAMGLGMTQSQERLAITQPGAPSRTNYYKFKLKQSGPVAGVTAGYSVKRGKNVFGVNLGGYRDMYTARNHGTNQALSGDPAATLEDAKIDLKRKYTIEFAGKVGRLVAVDTQVYGKLGVLRSQFRDQFSDAAADTRANTSGWGGIIGLGVQKDYESVAISVEYNYSYYEKVGTTMYADGGYKNVSKIRPQYHSVLLTLSKPF